jgi:membrane protein CcdC involved in cytochrome C biogenesis
VKGVFNMTVEEIRIIIKEAIEDSIDNNTFTTTGCNMYLIAFYMIEGTYETEYVEILKRCEGLII